MFNDPELNALEEQVNISNQNIALADADFRAARAVIVTCFGDVLKDADPAALGKDPKTRLQEWLQARRLPVPEYVVTATSGEAHAQLFQVECRIPALALAVPGRGASRRAAEQAAAEAAGLLAAQYESGATRGGG